MKIKSILVPALLTCALVTPAVFADVTLTNNTDCVITPDGYSNGPGVDPIYSFVPYQGEYSQIGLGDSGNAYVDDNNGIWLGDGNNYPSDDSYQGYTNIVTLIDYDEGCTYSSPCYALYYDECTDGKRANAMPPQIIGHRLLPMKEK